MGVLLASNDLRLNYSNVDELFNSEEENTVMTLNDIKGASFNEIVNVIEASF